MNPTDIAILEKMEALTGAIRELAESNRQVVDLVLAQQAENDGEEPGAQETYLDGTPMR